MKKLLFSVTLKDCRVETFCSGGPGGQHQNKTQSAVRITHDPSGAVGECREHKNQPQNKREAFRRLARNPKMVAWCKAQAHFMRGKKGIDETVDEQMKPENIKEEWRCQFCEKLSLAKDWKGGDICPLCGSKYDFMLAQEMDEC